MKKYSRNRALAVAAGIALAWAACLPAIADRSLIQEAVIDAPVAEVWRLFSTDEGVQQWMAPRVKIDLRVGGELRSSYNPDSTLDDEHTIINRILSYMPQRLLAIQNTQAPVGFENAELFQQAYSIVTFHPVGEAQTKVRIAGLNYGKGPEWDVIYDHFDKGNAYLLGVLQKVASENADERPAVASEPVSSDAIVSEVLVKASREDVWRAWTTSEGLAEFFTPRSDVELKLGGKYELYFAPDAPEGQRGSEGCRVLVYEPQRLLSLSWNAPPHLAYARQHHTWLVIEFEDAADVDGEHVRVRLTHMGYAGLKEAHPEHADEFEQARAYFQRVWPHVLERLKMTLEGE